MGSFDSSLSPDFGLSDRHGSEVPTVDAERKGTRSAKEDAVAASHHAGQDMVKWKKRKHGRQES